MGQFLTVLVELNAYLKTIGLSMSDLLSTNVKRRQSMMDFTFIIIKGRLSMSDLLSTIVKGRQTIVK